MDRKFSGGDFVLFLDEVAGYGVVVSKIDDWLEEAEKDIGEFTPKFKKDLRSGLIIPVIFFGDCDCFFYYFSSGKPAIVLNGLNELSRDVEKLKIILDNPGDPTSFVGCFLEEDLETLKVYSERRCRGFEDLGGLDERGSELVRLLKKLLSHG